MADVSICIPTYNGARYLEACLDSVLGQTYEDIEILAVDDGSTDATFEILERYAASDQRIRLVRNKHNLGLVGNWNRCIEMARGKWIKFLFQDDLLEPTCIEKMLALGEKTGCPLVVCRRDFIFEDVPASTHDVYQRFTSDISMDAVMKDREYLTSEQFCDVTLRFGSANNFVGEPSSTLIRHDLFQRLEGFNPALVQLCDLEFWLRVGVNYGIAYILETLTHFRVHAASATSNNSARQQFHKDVVDPLLLLRDFAYSPIYEGLRACASNRGVNLVRQYHKTLTAEIHKSLIGQAHHSNQITADQENLDALLPIYSSTPIPLWFRVSLGTKLGKTKLERLIDRHIAWRFRKP